MARKESLRGKMLITSHGGVGGTVTGSCHVLEARGFKMAVDLGLFQGQKDDKMIGGVLRNDSSSEEILKGTECIALTHAHIDHSARIPWAFAKGFRPRVYATEETVDFLKPMLENSVEVQERQCREKKMKKVLYRSHDVEIMFGRTKGIEIFKEIPIGNNLTIEFLPNGHVEGSSAVFVRNYNNYKNVFFTGDIGKPIQSLCGGYLDFASRYPKDPVHAIVMESTNFDRDPVSYDESRKKLLEIINETIDGGGNVLIPLIAFHRYPEIEEILHNAQQSGELPSRIRFSIDAPFPRILKTIYKPEYLTPRFGNDPYFYKTEDQSMSRFDLQNSTVVDSHKESIRYACELANNGCETVILASGGMGEYGRGINYLQSDFVKNPKNTVLYTCHQVEGTRGANMLHRKEQSKEKKLGAKICQLKGFTGHASKDESIHFIEKFNLGELETVMAVHGNLSSAEKLADAIRNRYGGVKAIVPRIGQVIELFS